MIGALLFASTTFAQWTGTNPLTTTSNVGIGVSSPTVALDVLGSGKFTEGLFINRIAPSSTASAAMHGILGHKHKSFWTEVNANQLAKDYFGSEYAGNPEFPLE